MLKFIYFSPKPSSSKPNPTIDLTTGSLFKKPYNLYGYKQLRPNLTSSQLVKCLVVK